MVKHQVQTDGRTFCGRTLANNGDGRPCKSCERVAETESARSERSCRAESVRRNEIEIPGFGSVPVRTLTAEDVVNPVALVDEDACPVHPGGFNIKGIAVCVGCEQEAIELIESATAAPITSYAADALFALMLGTGPSFMITDRKEVGRAFNIKRGWRVVISTLRVRVDPTVTADIVTPVAEADRDGTAALKPVTFADVAESCGWLSTDIDAVTAVADGPIGEGFWSCCMARPAVAVAFTSEETDQQVWYAACRSCASTVPANRLAVLPEGFKDTFSELA